MSENSEIFTEKSSIKASDLEHRRKINFNIGKYNAVVPQGKQQFENLELARERAKNTKWKAIENLDTQLEEFEKQFTKRGGKVIWAENSQQAIDEIINICQQKNCKTLVKSKSMVTEEIHLNHALEENGIESVETDLGEYIQQLDGEAPYHIVTPAMHKSKEDVAKLFTEKLGTPPNLTPEELTLVARNILRKKYVQAEVGVTGANFIISDIGGIAVTENEGNARLSCSFPNTHIVVVGIEKVIPSMGNISISVKTGDAKFSPYTFWGAVYWQYFEDLDKLKRNESPLKLTKQIFVEKNTEKGILILPIKEVANLEVGDKIKVRLQIQATRDIEYLQLKDQRAACLVPIETKNRYQTKGSWGYYQSNGKASTHFFIDRLSKGSYFIEFEQLVTSSGNFSNGLSSIESMYSPGFASYSDEIRIEVEDLK
jgi:L-lactate utilization protein LutC